MTIRIVSRILVGLLCLSCIAVFGSGMIVLGGAIVGCSVFVYHKLGLVVLIPLLLTAALGVGTLLERRDEEE